MAPNAPSSVDEPTALELRAAYADRSLGVVEVVAAALDRAAREDVVGAFTTLNPERALAEAAEAQRRIDDGEQDVHPLLGVPTAIKDLEATAGVRTTLGSAAFADWIPDADETIVTVLRDAGLVSIGKTTVPELGAACYTEPDVAPPARSPYDLERSAAGSSGGAAAAVGARLVPVAQGSDTAGSLRSPASACGVIGMKPSRGLLTGGSTATDGIGLTTKGPIARSVRDTAALLDAMAAAAPAGTIHPARRRGFLLACDETVGPLRVVVAEGSVSGGEVAPELAAACADVGVALAAAGHHIETRTQPTDTIFVRDFTTMFSALAGAKPVPVEREHQLRPIVRHLRHRASTTTAGELAAAILGTQSAAGRWAERFADADIVVSPTMTRPPTRVGELRDDTDPAGELEAMTLFTGNTVLANATGFPAISLPLGWSASRLPLGVSLTARWGRDDLLLAVAAQLERLLPWSDHIPPLRRSVPRTARS
ncbi:amidase [Leifsonia naganoensis]|uniref:Amidase n=1 Tax=Leifsonia naganoensis TaxID=150025 RepID=A0A853DIM2_9MICO|nr:amidase [Leifsonia naganoensis]NYK09022.1 amidase [Leifsonia naganoensis]